MAKVKLRIVENASLNVGGRVYRTGDVVEVDRDNTAEQWLAAGWVVELRQPKPGKR